RDLLRNAPDVIGRYFETAQALGVIDDGRRPKLLAEPGHVTNRIAIAPGVRHWNKRWPPEYFHELSEQLIARGFELTFYGSNDDIDTIEDIRRDLSGNHQSLAGKTDLAEAARSIGTCSLLIA